LLAKTKKRESSKSRRWKSRMFLFLRSEWLLLLISKRSEKAATRYEMRSKKKRRSKDEMKMMRMMTLNLSWTRWMIQIWAFRWMSRWMNRLMNKQITWHLI
jgi:hypothetical protein